MKRFIKDNLITWKNDKYRKPLIINGTRQVGKTYIVREFANENYEGLAEFNFDHDKDLAQLFSNTKDSAKIIEQLSFIYGKAIIPGKTLIFFDEIQECPDALNALKYFKENANEYHIISAGSLLGLKLSHTSFPVGKVQYLDMYPMSFSEFLIANGSENLVKYMNSIDSLDPIPDIFFNQLQTYLKEYMIIGGMPEVVQMWVNEKDISRVNTVQDDLLKDFENDFSKHTTAFEANKISLIWHSLPSQLARENKKFLYQSVKGSARAREYENAVNWLNDSRCAFKIYNSTKVALPLDAYRDLSSFKIYLCDCGLLSRMSKLNNKVMINGNQLFSEFKGAITENFVLNMLMLKFNQVPNYYTFNRYEIDFMINYDSSLLPVEVKSGNSTNNKSLTEYIKLNSPDIAIRYSLNNLDYSGNVLNIPLFMIEHSDKLIKLAIK